LHSIFSGELARHVNIRSALTYGLNNSRLIGE
jgi:hypothetical protein